MGMCKCEWGQTTFRKHSETVVCPRFISVLCGAIIVYLKDGVWLYSYESVWRVLKGAGVYAMAAVVYLVIKTIHGVWKARQQNTHGG